MMELPNSEMKLHHLSIVFCSREEYFFLQYLIGVKHEKRILVIGIYRNALFQSL